MDAYKTWMSEAQDEKGKLKGETKSQESGILVGFKDCFREVEPHSTLGFFSLH